MLYLTISGHGFMVEISISVVLWGFGSKIPRFRLEAHEGVRKSGGQGEISVVFGKRGVVKLCFGVYVA